MLDENLYIKVDDNNNPISHPYLESNLKNTIENFDPENLPSGFKKFRRLSPPEAPWKYITEHSGTYNYNSEDDVYEDIWTVRPFNEEEIQAIKNSKLEDSPSFVWDDDACAYVPPISKPTENPDEGKYWEWNEEVVTWFQKKIPDPPSEELPDGYYWKWISTNNLNYWSKEKL